MAVAFVQEFTLETDDRSTTNYDAVAGELGAAADPPAGLILHTAGFDEERGVFRIFSVWDSRADGERFMEKRLLPIVTRLSQSRADATPPDAEYYYELHDVGRPGS